MMKLFGKKKKKDKEDDKKKGEEEASTTSAATKTSTATPSPKPAASKPAAAAAPAPAPAEKKPSATATKSKAAAPTKKGGKTAVVDLPKNYVAFVLPDGSKGKPTASELEKLRTGTIGYLEGKLRAKNKHFSHLDVNFVEVEHGTGRPFERFNLFIVAQAKAHYNEAGGVPPEKGEVFEQYISSFVQSYLDKVLRKLPDSKSLLNEALEVRARLLTPETPGGAVTLPKFYIAFQSKKEPKEPSKAKQDQLVKLYLAEATRLLKKEYEDDFDKLNVFKVIKVELNAGKPDPKYNIYIEFEAVAKFHKNVPDEPMDLFRAIAATSDDFSKEVMGLGSPYKDSSQMAIRCVYVQSFDVPGGKSPGSGGDGGDGPEGTPNDKPKQEDDNDDGDPDDGDPEDKPKGEDDGGGGGGSGGGAGAPGTDDPDRAKVKVQLGFYVALVMQNLEGMPTDVQMYTFDTKMEEFFSATLKQKFPNSFVNLKFAPTPQVDAGIPLPRFNLLHEYDATINFYHPPPDGMEVLKQILYCDLSDLYSKIKSLPAPYDNMTEFTLRRALEKEITTEAYGGKLGNEEKRKREAEEKARREAEEKARKEAEARAAAEKKKAEEAAAAKKRAEEEKKRKEEEEAAAKKAKEEAARRKREEEAAAKKKKEEEEAKKRKLEEAAKAKKKAEDEEKKRKEEEARRRKEAEEAAAKKAAEEKRKKEEEAAKAKALAEKKRKEQEAAAAAKAKAAKEAKEKEEAERKRKAKEAAAAKKKAEEAAAAAAAAEEDKMGDSSMGGSSRRESIIKTEWIPVESSDLYVALTMPMCKVEPSQSDYNTLAKATRDFYHKALKKQYPNYKSIELAVGLACFKQNKPSDNYDVYLEWDITFHFGDGDIPGRIDINTFLMSIDLTSYLMLVRDQKGTPFEAACGIYVQKVSKRSSIKM